MTLSKTGVDLQKKTVKDDHKVSKLAKKKREVPERLAAASGQIADLKRKKNNLQTSLSDQRARAETLNDSMKDSHSLAWNMLRCRVT